MGYTIKIPNGYDLSDLAQWIRDYEENEITEEEFFELVTVEGERGKYDPNK